MGVLISKQNSIEELPNYYWKRAQIFQSKFKQKRQKDYSLFINTLTNEEVEQYTLFFHSNNHYLQYLDHFQRRLSEDYLVNTRFISTENIFSFCKYGKLAKVYTERIPLRLSDLKNMQQGDYLFLLINALRGFQQLFEAAGYFRTTQKMVGLDAQGRVKVWLNPNFSQMKVYQSLDTDMMKRKHRNTQKQMVSQVIALFHRFNTKFYSKKVKELFKQKEELTFRSAVERILNYSQSNKIQIKKYYQSILPVFRNKTTTISDYQPNVSKYGDDFDDQMLNPIHQKDRTIYYINPLEEDENDLKSESGFQMQEKKSEYITITRTNSLVFSGQQTQSRINYEQTPKYNFKIINKQESKCSSSIKNSKIKFNYQSCVHTPTHTKQFPVNLSQKKQLSVLVYNQKSCAISDRNSIYQYFGLDKQIISDMEKYLHH